MSRPAEWRAPLFYAGGCAVVLMVGVATIRETYRQWNADQGIETLAEKANALEARKRELSALVRTLQSPDTLDREARLRLGLKKPGERVFVLPGAVNHAEQEQDARAAEQSARAKISNPQKWLSYFLHRQKEEAGS